MKRKNILILFLFIFVFMPTVCLAASSGYTPMEKIPGFESVGGDFPSYIMAVYKFGLWTVGLAALLMISIGGFMYITSAGNKAQTGKAKTIITDSIIGIIMALTSYILLYTINPSLVQLTTISGNIGGGGGGGGGGTGQCQPVTSGPCSVDSLKGSCFDGKADLSKISSLCNKESGGVDGRMSTSDTCSNTARTSFSCGLLQVNLTCVCKGQSAFTGSEPTKGCASFSCTGPGPNYKSCTDQNCWGTGNINAACQLYNEHSGNKYDTWSENKNCGFS